jgi:hypothetical protein
MNLHSMNSLDANEWLHALIAWSYKLAPSPFTLRVSKFYGVTLAVILTTLYYPRCQAHVHARPALLKWSSQVRVRINGGAWANRILSLKTFPSST